MLEYVYILSLASKKGAGWWLNKYCFPCIVLKMKNVQRPIVEKDNASVHARVIQEPLDAQGGHHSKIIRKRRFVVVVVVLLGATEEALWGFAARSTEHFAGFLCIDTALIIIIFYIISK